MLLLLWLLHWSDYLWNLLRPRIPKQYLRPRALRRGLFLRKLLKLREKWNHVGRPRKQVKMELEQYERRTGVNDGGLVLRQCKRQSYGYHWWRNYACTIPTRPYQEKVSRCPPMLIHISGPAPFGKLHHVDCVDSLSSKCFRMVLWTSFSVHQAFRIPRNWWSKSKNEPYAKTWSRVCLKL